MTDIIFYKKSDMIKWFVKDLRQNMTKAEKLLRARLRGKQVDGLKFHRQKAIWISRWTKTYDRFIIADFYHHPSRTIIEIDGGIHMRADIAAKDRMKEEILTGMWYVVVRYTNDEVYTDIDAVVEGIRGRCFSVTPLAPLN